MTHYAAVKDEDFLDFDDTFEMKGVIYVVMPEVDRQTRASPCDGCAFEADAVRGVGCHDLPSCGARIFMTRENAVTYKLTGRVT